MDERDVVDLWKRTHGSIVDDPDAPTAASYKAEETAAGDDRTLDREVSSPTWQRPKPAAPEPLGDRADDFELVEEIGRGGMGLVYRAHQKSLDRDVAVKVIRPEQRNPRAQERFVSEARVSGALDHPNIVPVHALGETDRGDVFLAMKRVSGRSWKALLHPASDDDREAAARVDLDGHLAILIAVSNAVAYAHARGIVHRDLKPENVMVGAFGEVMVMDWGIAVDVREPPVEGAAAPHRSTCRAPAGTPCYMAPELVEGRGPDIGSWTDTYLLGAILYEVLVGHAPHKGATLYEVLALARASSPPIPQTVPPALAAIVRRAMAREPGDRYATAPELAEDLRAYGKVRESDRIAAAALARLTAAEKSARESDDDTRRGLYRELGEVASAFAQALVLWPGNAPAAAGQRAARLTHARLALSGGDLGLARAQLDQLPGDADATALLGEVRAAGDAQRERERAARRVRSVAAGLAVALFAGLAVGFAWIRAERNEAQHQRNEAQTQRNEAQHQRDEATRRLGESLVSQGDALAASGDWENARLRYEEARETSLRVGAPVRDADLGLMDLHRRSPRPLLVMGGLAKPLTKPPPGHDASIFCLAFSPDGGTLLSGGDDGRVIAWDPLTGKLLREFPPQGRQVRGVVFTAPDRAVSITNTGTLREWDVAAGRELRKLELPLNDKVSVAMMAHASATRQLLIPTYAGRIRRVDLAAWKELPPLVHEKQEGKGGLLRSVAPSSDGQRILSVGMGDQAPPRMFDMGGDSYWLMGAGKSHWGSAYSPDDRRIALAGEDRVIRVMDADTGNLTHTLSGHREAVLALAFDPAGERLASVARDQTVRLWDPEKGVELACFTGHEQYPIACAFSPDGELLATAGQDATIRIWPARATPVARPLAARGGSEVVAWSQDSKRVALTGSDATMTVHDVATGLVLAELGKKGELHSPIAFAPGGETVYARGNNAIVKVALDAPKSVERVAPLPRDWKGVALTPDGSVYAVVRAGGEVEVREVARAGLEKALAGFAIGIELPAALKEPAPASNVERFIALSPDGRLVATSANGEITVRDARTMAKRWSGKSEPSVVLGLRFSPDGKRLFVSGRDRLASLWDVASGRVEKQFVDESGVTWAGTIAPDGGLLATASATSLVHLFDVKTGRRVRSLAAHGHMCYGVSWSPDGRWLVTAGSLDGFVWDLHHARTLRETEARLQSDDLSRARYLAMRDVPGAALKLMKTGGPEKELLAKRVRARRKTEETPPTTLAAQRLDRGDAKGAEAALREMDPRDGMSHYLLARARLALGKQAEARTSFDQAVRLMPEWTTAWAARADLRGKAGDDAGALEDLKRAEALDPKSIFAVSVRAEQHVRMKRWTDAVGAWTRAIELAPKSPRFVFERAKANAALKNLPQALSDCELLVKLAPKAPAAWFSRGEAHELNGLFKEALKDYEKALELDPAMNGAKVARERVAKKIAITPLRAPTDTR